MDFPLLACCVPRGVPLPRGVHLRPRRSAPRVPHFGAGGRHACVQVRRGGVRPAAILLRRRRRRRAPDLGESGGEPAPPENPGAHPGGRVDGGLRWGGGDVPAPLGRDAAAGPGPPSGAADTVVPREAVGSLVLRPRGGRGGIGAAPSARVGRGGEGREGGGPDGAPHGGGRGGPDGGDRQVEDHGQLSPRLVRPGHGPAGV
mmetsp:Transcript_2869/g.5982  ORF Transcript_2869/g.5982 Transcript_2869/m.5982 type:complete len:202 (-) Transcript_2869:742-1347(-)